MPAVLSKPVTEHEVYDVDEEEYAAGEAGRGRTQRPQKRGQADSGPLSERFRVVVNRKATPFEPSSPRASTPAESEPTLAAPSELDTSLQVGEGGGSDADPTEVDRDHQRDKTKHKRMKKAPEVELEDAIARIKASKSKAYDKFKDPVIDWKNNPPTHYKFVCKGSGAPGAALAFPKHPAFSAIQLTEENVHEYVVLWVAEDGRPYRIIGDRYLRKLIAPQGRGYIPHCETIAQDIKVMYNTTQAEIMARLAELTGTFHIALDMFQAGNGFDFLHVVLFHQGVKKDGSPTIDRFLLECLSFGGESHTGHALATSVYNILCKFKVQDRVWAVVCDNASNNAKMMEHLAEYGLKRLSGPNDRVFCMLHIINLAAQAIASEFRKKQPKSHGDDNDDEQYNIIDFDQPEVDPTDINENDVEHAPSWALCGNDDEEDPFGNIELPAIEPGTAEALESTRVGTILIKTAKFAHRLRYSSKVKKVFKEACVEKEVEMPHNVRRDQKMRWNSTGDMSGDAKRTFTAIVATQQDPRLAIPRPQRLVMEDLKYINGLITLLEPLKSVTEILSRGGVPMLANILVHFDALDYIYTNIAADENQPAWMRHGAKRALTVLNKHYGKTDSSNQYRLAVLFHPSMCVHYLKQADWPQEWIDTAIAIAVLAYEKFYKPAGTSNAQAKAPSTSQFGYSSYMSQLYKSVDSEGTSSTCPVREFVNGAVVFDYGEDGEPVFHNPLAWWYNQCVAGNEWSGLTQMALDVLSTPATSVNVERAFSFASFMVGKRRHSLSSYSIQSTVTLGCYSKAGLVKPGCLAQALAQAKEADKPENGKGKSKPKPKPKPKSKGAAKGTNAA